MSPNNYSPKDLIPELRHKAESKLKKTVKKSNQNKKVQKIASEIQNDELILSQSELLESLKDYSTFFDSAPVGYFILDKNGVIRNVNKTGCLQIGIDKMQLIGQHLTTFLSNEFYKHNFHQHRQHVVESEKPQQVECEIRKKNGSFFIALIESSYIKEGKNLNHFLSTISDISSRKEQELEIERALVKEKELNEMKSQFISIASHEFRTPLTTILSSSDLIEKYEHPENEEKRKKHLFKIKSSVYRLKEILMDFLSVSEAEKGNIQNNPETFNLVKFTEDILEETKTFNRRHDTKYKHIGLHHVFLDMKLLKICLTNLITNAYKYSPSGGIIEITTEHSSPTHVTILVKDVGIGIPDNDAPHIFETFFRAKNADGIQGTGLGLHITYKFVNIMGGNISFFSKENKGTTFILKFQQHTKNNTQ